MLEFIGYLAVGFLAQMIDGSMGMAYGVSCSTFLRSVLGVPSLISTACIHIAEVFTSLFSGVSHYKLGNFDKSLFIMLAISGSIGGILGVIALSYNLLPQLDRIIDFYLLLMGIYIISKVFINNSQPPKNKNVPVIGFFGGFLDAVGGGGWGPIVTTNLLVQSPTPQTVIGSVSASEFFVTIIQTAFFIIYGIPNLEQYILVIVGLIIGGMLAAPLAAIAVSKIPHKFLFVLVGSLIVFLNAYKLFFS